MKTMAGKPNLRQQQRVPTNLEVTVTHPDGTCITCKTANLSRAGMMVECDSARVQELVPDRLAVAPKDPIQLSIKFSVPVVSVQSVNVEAQCDVVHIRRISRQVFHLGLQFRFFEGNGHDYVDQYVSRLLSKD
ncbi:PilZ domain-containing protein [Marinobacter nanhaiticus D15-8W]|uniref:PilZ domain-containing protein n=1 Tax=Marinobacter nanhaiticus D15-8W TaxID=626887 RepID=N6WP70_9GAMM|nr:PilZ domain-containing protein [Marinobacter nanhaiticus D15-8W]